MKTTYPKLGFRNASVEQKLSTCGRFVHAAAKLPPEKREKIPITELETDLADAQAASAYVLNLRMQMKAALLTRDRAVDKICTGTMSQARYYAICLAENPAEVCEAGLEPEASKRTRTGPPGTPTHLRATALCGAVKLLWKNPMRRSVFTIEYKEGSLEGGEWLQPRENVLGRAKTIIPNLKPGVQYFFRVKAHNPNGESAWSHAVAVRPM